MTVMFHDSAEENQSFTTQAWTQVVSKSGNLNGVANYINFYAEYGGSVVNREVGIRVLVDGVERAFDYHTPTLANQYKAFCTFGVLVLTEPGSHTISVEVRALSAGQTVLVRRIRLMLFQV
jgi:hypothetical protein